jgi:hypothetical protein
MSSIFSTLQYTLNSPHIADDCTPSRPLSVRSTNTKDRLQPCPAHDSRGRSFQKPGLWHATPLDQGVSASILWSSLLRTDQNRQAAHYGYPCPHQESCYSHQCSLTASEYHIYCSYTCSVRNAIRTRTKTARSWYGRVPKIQHVVSPTG